MHCLTFGRLRHFGPVDAALLLLSIASAVAYPLALRRGLVAVVLKALVVAPLAVVAFRVLDSLGGRAVRPRAPDAHVLLAAALLLSSAGDVLLALDWRRYVRYALVAFMLAHLAYIRLFVASWRRPLRPSPWQLALVFLVVGYGATLTTWVGPRLGPLTPPVLLYAGVITAMVVSAILAGFARPTVAIGALLFLLSDSLIAVARFRGWMPLAVLIWPAYFLGQYAITVGFLWEHARADGPARPPLP